MVKFSIYLNRRVFVMAAARGACTLQATLLHKKRLKKRVSDFPYFVFFFFFCFQKQSFRFLFTIYNLITTLCD